MVDGCCKESSFGFVLERKTKPVRLQKETIESRQVCTIVFCSFSRIQQHVCTKLARSRDGAVSRSLAFFGIPSCETTVSALHPWGEIPPSPWRPIRNHRIRRLDPQDSRGVASFRVLGKKGRKNDQCCREQCQISTHHHCSC